MITIYGHIVKTSGHTNDPKPTEIPHASQKGESESLTPGVIRRLETYRRLAASVADCTLRF